MADKTHDRSPGSAPPSSRPGQQDPAGPWVEKGPGAEPSQDTPGSDHTEGRDRPPSGRPRDDKGPWLGGG